MTDFKLNVLSEVWFTWKMLHSFVDLKIILFCDSYLRIKNNFQDLFFATIEGLMSI